MVHVSAPSTEFALRAVVSCSPTPYIHQTLTIISWPTFSVMCRASRGIFFHIWNNSDFVRFCLPRQRYILKSIFFRTLTGHAKQRIHLSTTFHEDSRVPVIVLLFQCLTIKLKETQINQIKLISLQIGVFIPWFPFTSCFTAKGCKDATFHLKLTGVQKTNGLKRTRTGRWIYKTNGSF